MLVQSAWKDGNGYDCGRVRSTDNLENNALALRHG